MNENPYESPQAVEPLVPQIKKVPDLLACAHCGSGHSATGHDGPVSKDSFGFREFECRACRNITTLPLPRFYRLVYWVFLAVCAASIVFGIAFGVFPFLALFAIIPAYVLYKDRTILRVNAALANKRGPP
jgi:hypothetical protein